MALKLRVISDHYKVLGKRSSQLFGVTGGRIGRAQDNDWILPDPDRYVSSHHCKVAFKTGEWLLEDTSTNGVFVNGSDIPVSADGTHHLQDGDRLRLGDYELIVSIDARNDFSPDASGQMPVPPRTRTAAVRDDEDLGEELDLTDLLGASMITEAPELITRPRFSGSRGIATTMDAGDAPAPRGGSSTPAKTPASSSPASAEKPRRIDSVLDLAQALQPQTRTQTSRAAAGASRSAAPSTEPGPTSMFSSDPNTLARGHKPDDWQMQTRPYDLNRMSQLSPAPGTRQDRPETERSRRSGEAPGEASSGVEAFCRGAGIDPASLPQDSQNALLTLTGQMVREMTLGLMDVLKGRADLKNRLRLSQTTIQPGENNPLKFSASVDEALVKLLDPHGSRYLGPIEAIRDSFSDLRTHQMALSTAIHAAADEMMNRIEPGDLQERFDRGLKRGALLGAANKMKYWDLYTEFYHVLNQRNEQGLPTLFAEELARSYEDRAAQKKR